MLLSMALQMAYIQDYRERVSMYGQRAAGDCLPSYPREMLSGTFAFRAWVSQSQTLGRVYLSSGVRG